MAEDYKSIGLSLRAHPVSFLRPELQKRGMISCADLATIRDGRRVVVPGIVLVRQKPGSAKGVMFITIEDETGVANLILWPDRFERQRRLVMSAGMIACHGRVQREGEVTHVITDHSRTCPRSCAASASWMRPSRSRTAAAMKRSIRSDWIRAEVAEPKASQRVTSTSRTCASAPPSKRRRGTSGRVASQKKA